jgi:hypothetical protein
VVPTGALGSETLTVRPPRPELTPGLLAWFSAAPTAESARSYPTGKLIPQPFPTSVVLVPVKTVSLVTDAAEDQGTDPGRTSRAGGPLAGGAGRARLTSEVRMPVVPVVPAVPVVPVGPVALDPVMPVPPQHPSHRWRPWRQPHPAPPTDQPNLRPLRPRRTLTATPTRILRPTHHMKTRWTHRVGAYEHSTPRGVTHTCAELAGIGLCGRPEATPTTPTPPPRPQATHSAPSENPHANHRDHEQTR